MHTPVSCKKRKRFTLKSHTVKTVMISKNIIANRNAVSIAWYLFSFSAAAFSLALSLSTFLVSAIVKNNTKRKPDFSNTDVLYAAILMRRPVTGLYPGSRGQGRGSVGVRGAASARGTTTIPGACFSKDPITYRAGKAIFSSWMT